MTLAAFAAGTAGAQKVKLDYDREVDFSKYQTYAWRQGAPAASELTQRRIAGAIEEQLESAGLERVEGEADLYVLTFAVTDQKIKQRAVNVGVGVHRRTKRGSVSIGGSTGGRVRRVTVGSLVIDLLDGETEELVWQAVAEGTLSSDPKKNAEKAASAVQKAFAKFPS
jgi:hypothetical protein